MGNENSGYQQKFRRKYTFIQSLMDKNFGLIKVYRRNELNFDYVMMIERAMGNYELQECKQHFEIIKAGYAMHKEPMLLRLYNIEEIVKSECGPKGLRLYIEYLNFSLKDIMEQKKLSFRAFNMQEIMLILQSVVQTYHYFKQLKFNAFSIRSDTIFITPEGYLRFSPIKIESEPQPLQTCDCLSEEVVKNFQKSERQFVIEMKNLLQEIVSICPKNDELFYPSHQLLSNVYHSKTLQHIMRFIKTTELQSLSFGKNPQQSSEMSTDKERNMDFFSNVNEKQKKSLKSSQSRHPFG